MDFTTYIRAFLDARPAISVRQIEQAARVPETLLHRALNGTRNLPKKHRAGIVRVLSEYGLNIDDLKTKTGEAENPIKE